MSLRPLLCPNCNGTIRNLDETTKKGFCPYCDAVIVDVQARQRAYATTARGELKVAAADFEISGGTLVRYHGASPEVTVPKGVSVIGPDAFCGMKGITTVVLPEGVLEIERNRDYGQDHGAFNGCIRLQRVVFPSTLETIGAQAFLGCAALSDVAFPPALKSIGFNAFDGCASLQRALFPNSLKTIGPHAFQGCSMLSQVILPDNIDIGAAAFRACSIRDLRIPRGATLDPNVGSSHASPFDTVPDLNYDEYTASFGRYHRLRPDTKPSTVRRIVFASMADLERLKPVLGYGSIASNLEHIDYIIENVNQSYFDKGLFERTSRLRNEIAAVVAALESDKQRIAGLYPMLYYER